MRKLLGVVALAFAAGCVCCGAKDRAAAPRARHVVVVGFDGLGAHYIPWDRCPNFAWARTNGAWSVHCRSCFPPISSVNWKTMLTGSSAEMHGHRNWNTVNPEVPAIVGGHYPELFSEMARQRPAAKTLTAWDWDVIGAIHATNSVTAARYFATKDYELTNQQAMADWFLGEYRALKPELSFLYFGQPDETGHQKGWGSSAYLAKCVELDAQLGRVLKTVAETTGWNDTIVILLADHGGKDKGHSGENLPTIETPLVLCGANVPKGELKETVMLYDVAPTIYRLLGLAEPDTCRGKPLFNR